MAAVKRWLKLLPALCALLALALTPLAGMTGLGEAGEVVSDWAEAAVPEAAPELIPEEAEPEVIAAVPNAAPAGDIDPFREISCGDTRFVYSDEMLMGNAAALSTDLAKASVALAQAAYGSDGATITNTMIVETLTGSMG